MDQRWPWLVLAGALWALALGLTFLTCQTEHLGTAMWAAISGMAACLVSGLVIAECVFRHVLTGVMDRHREKMTEVVVDERVRIEDIARESTHTALAEVLDLPRPRQ
mgnify:FL=1